MFKRLFGIGLLAGAIAALAAIVYQKVYFKANGADFSKIVSTGHVITGCLAGTLIASLGYFFLHKWLKGNTAILFNFIFGILSFATIIWPVSAKLPLDIDSPELFPGLAVPMHFFPLIAWLILSPLLQRLDKQ
jgi:mannitol-specific phosphotransferase system IIBC component